MDIHNVVADYGFPTGLLLIIAWALRSAGKFLAPLLRSGIEKHIELVDTLKCNIVHQTELLESHGELLEEIHQAVKPGVANP